jgi:two-component system response regulator
MERGDIEVLLVEDDPRDAELTIRTLRKANMANRLQHVVDGAEALDFLFAQGPFATADPQLHLRVVLLDLKLPKIGGIEVLRRIKADERTRLIPVVVLTSSTEPPDMRECYGLGVNSYVHKPVEFGEFTKAVAELGLYWLIINKPVS